MADPEHESNVLYPLEKGFVREQKAEEGSGDDRFLCVEVWDWELYAVSKGKKADKTDHRLLKKRELVDVEGMSDKGKEVFLRGNVKGKAGVVVVRSAPLVLWSSQRVNSEYRVWLLSSRKSKGLDLWYLLGAKCSKDYEKIWEPMRKLLQAFKPLLDAVGRGPPSTAEVDWLWPKAMKWNDVDAAVIMDHVESLQPSARQLLEENPDWVLTNFIETLPELGYAGVSRDDCEPKWYTLNEYFEFGSKHNARYPQKTFRDAAAQSRQYSLNNNEDVEVDFDDSSKATLQEPITCRICGGRTRSYEKGDMAGIQHFAFIEGKKVQLDNVPMCSDGKASKAKNKAGRKRQKKDGGSALGGAGGGGAAYVGDAEEPDRPQKPLPQFGCKKKKVALSHSFGAVACPVCQRRTFDLPDQAATMEKHLKSHLEGIAVPEAVSIANTLRVRIAIEDIFPAELIQ